VTDAHHYPANVFWSLEDDGFIALAPDLPGCSAYGKTQQHALKELQDAIVAWIEAARAAGNPIPEPSQPPPDNIFSGKILVRMPRSLHAHLAQVAKADAVSLNQHIVYLLTWAATHHSLTSGWCVTGQGSTLGTSWFSAIDAGGFTQGAVVNAVGTYQTNNLVTWNAFGEAGSPPMLASTLPGETPNVVFMPLLRSSVGARRESA
jgi:predicted RNase H-like HicB family nuclease